MIKLIGLALIGGILAGCQERPQWILYDTKTNTLVDYDVSKNYCIQRKGLTIQKNIVYAKDPTRLKCKYGLVGKYT